jgi:hypothetical protein
MFRRLASLSIRVPVLSSCRRPQAP